jgi:hypothetical protein
MTIIKIFDKYPEIFKRISSYIKQQCLDIISTIDKIIKKCKIIEEVDLMLTLNGFGI